MVVYVVAGGYEYEGETMDSVRVFSRREDAEAYAEALRRPWDGTPDQAYFSGYDYAVIEERTIS